MRKIIIAITALALSASAAFGQSVGKLQPGNVWGNSTASVGYGKSVSIGAIFDQQFTCSARGSILFRGSAAWTCLAPGTVNFPLLSGGAGADLSYGALPVAGGGIGITSGTSGGIPYFSASGTIASSAALTANRLVLGGGAGAAPTIVGSLGTNTTVLHGNAAGAPTFGAVSLTADVTGNLPVTNLNSGTSASASTYWRGDGTWSTPAGAGTVTSAQISAGAGISVSGTCTITSSGNCTVSQSLTSATLVGAPSNPANTSSTSGEMAGFGVSTCRLAPVYSTRMEVTFYGQWTNNTNSNGIFMDVRYGTGAGPANNTAASGTQIAGQIQNSVVTGNFYSTFSLTTIVTGLTPSTTYWFDINRWGAANTTILVNVKCVVKEF